MNSRPRLSPVAAPALLGAAFFLATASAAADTVAVVSRGGDGIVQTAQESLRSAVTAQGHRQPSEEAVGRAVGKVADGVVDTRAEYKIVAEPLSADWVITGRFTPFGASARPGYRAEVEVYQAKTGRVESLNRDVDARVAQAIAQLFHPMLYPRTSKVLELSQEEIGLLTGLSRQRVNQELKGFEREGAVRIEPARLVVLSRDKLLQIAER